MLHFSLPWRFEQNSTLHQSQCLLASCHSTYPSTSGVNPADMDSERVSTGKGGIFLHSMEIRTPVDTSHVRARALKYTASSARSHNH
jgi:hypothetical protein